MRRLEPSLAEGSQALVARETCGRRSPGQGGSSRAPAASRRRLRLESVLAEARRGLSSKQQGTSLFGGDGTPAAIEASVELVMWRRRLESWVSAAEWSRRWSWWLKLGAGEVGGHGVVMS